MEDTIPALGALILPTITYKYIMKNDLPNVFDRLPIFLYVIVLFSLGSIAYSINMKRHCQKIYTKRILFKTLLYITMTMIIFGGLNYVMWSVMFQFNVDQLSSQLFINGIFLMICSQSSYYMTKIMTSNC